MTDVTILIAISFLEMTGFFLVFHVAKVTNDLSAQIATGVVRGTPVSPRVREGMLFNMWLPFEFAMVASLAFVGLAQLEMADHVSDAGVKLLAHLAAFLAAIGCAFIFVTAPFAFFRFRAKLRRVRQRQAEAD